MWRLLRTAWARRGSLQGDERALAAVAGVDQQTWAALAPRVLWAIGFDGAMCGPVAVAIEELERRQAATRATKAAAGRMGAARRWSEAPGHGVPLPPHRPMAGDSTCMAPAKHVLPTAISEQPGAVVRAQRTALERFDLDMNLERSSAQTVENQTSQDVLGRIHAGLDATAAGKLSEWRRMRSREMLEQAASRWLKAGRLTDRHGRLAEKVDLAFVIRIAGHPFATPALMSIAIQRADEADAASRLGYVCSALGATRGGKPLQPYLNDQAVLEHWARLEAAQVDAARAKAAVTDVLARVNTGGRGASAQAVEPNETEYAARRGVLAGLKTRTAAGGGSGA